MAMAQTSWFDEHAQHPTLHERVEKLESFNKAMADGVVDKAELELTAYNIMRLLHELQAERARVAFTRT